MSEAMQTKQQFSAGGVVYRKTGPKTEVAILTRGEGKIFCLPKGKTEKPETPQQAAPPRNKGRDRAHRHDRERPRKDKLLVLFG